MRLRSLVIATALAATTPAAAVAQACPTDTITASALGVAMRAARRAPGGDYSLLATMNSVRFQSGVIQYLIEDALERHREGGTFFVPHDILWWEFLKVAGLGKSEETKAPMGRRLAFDYHQGMRVTYGPPSKFIKDLNDGPEPLLAANVTLDWPDRSDGRRKYSFVDSLAVPILQVTNHQVQTFRFVVFDGMVAFEDIHGISGRPMSGLLGTIFKILGEGHAVYSRFSISTDGMQVMRTKASKVFSRTVTGTIAPNGRAENGVPEGRADLIALETRLRQMPDFKYYEYTCVPRT
jgi:hypothetical protein